MTVPSKSCKVCKEAQHTIGREAQEFQDSELLQFQFQWFFSNYGSGRCSILWSRSVERNKQLYCDPGNYIYVNFVYIYGDHIFVFVMTPSEDGVCGSCTEAPWEKTA